MRSDMAKWRNLRRLLELMSYDIVAIEKYWKLNNAESDVSESWPTLQEQTDFTDSTFFKCYMDRQTLKPVVGEGKVEMVHWVFALLYDVSEARGLVKREHPEDGFKIADAFADGRFIGWEVRFFDALDEVEQYIKQHPEYSDYSLYKGFKKLPFKYGYYEGVKRVCCNWLDYYEHEFGFIEVPDLYKLTVQSKTEYHICPLESDLISCLKMMVEEFVSVGEEYQCEVEIGTRHEQHRALLVCPKDCNHSCFLIYEGEE